MLQKWPGQEQRQCEVCDSAFWTWPRKPGRFCSRSCSSAGVAKAARERGPREPNVTFERESSEQIEYSCEVCERVFWSNNRKPLKTCSRQCRGAAIGRKTKRRKKARTDPQQCRKCQVLKPLVEFPILNGEHALRCEDCCTTTTTASTKTKVHAGQVQYCCEGCKSVFWRYPNPGRGRYCSKECKQENQKGNPPAPRTDPQSCVVCGISQPLASYPINNGVPGLKCKECRRKSNPEQKRRSHLWAKFKITLEEWIALYESQQGCCPICSTKLPGLDSLMCEMSRKDAWSTRNWNTDHCHVTGKVRGITCRKCNMGLGTFRDDPAIMRRAAEYIEKHCTDHTNHVVDGVLGG